MQCCYAYSFPIFQHRSHYYYIFSHYDFLLCSALMPVRIFWLSSVPNFVTHFRSNLYYLNIINAFIRVAIPASFLKLGILGGIFFFFFFIATVTSWRFFYILYILLLVTVSFLVVLCTLLGDVGFSFSAHLLHLAWVEASFEVLAVHSIEEQDIVAPAVLASTLTTTSPSASVASSAAFNLWYPSPILPLSLVLVVLCEYEGLSNPGLHVGHIAKPIPKLVVLDIGLGQCYDQVILDLYPINQSLRHSILCNLVSILRDFWKCCP